MIKKLLVSRTTISTGFFVLFLFLVGGLNVAFAQTSLPAGGSSFETAVSLSPGTYQGGALQGWQELYYIVQVKAGQQIIAEARGFSEAGCNLFLFNESKEELMSNYGENPKVSWLPNANKSSYNYYFKIANDYADVESFTVEVSLTNYYDANSSTDAGATFESALNLNTIPGSYTGYLSKAFYDIPCIGDDDEDFYRISIQKGIPYEFKLTPPTKGRGTLALYDATRQLIEEKYSPNEGAFISLFLTPAANTSVFLTVSGDLSCDILNYKLDIKSSVSVTKFYACNGQYCESAGEFSSLAKCQESTTKTCYQTENCDNRCGTPPECVKDSDCPAGASCVNGTCVGGGVCQDVCVSGKTKCFDNFNYNKCGDYNNDGCSEWSTPVYCGEKNKCQNGKCVKANGCTCSAWMNEGCNKNDCQKNEMSQTRTCEPKNCDKQNQCLSDPSCIIPPPPPPPPPPSPFALLLAFLKRLPIWKWFIGWYSLFWLAFYIYFALCLQLIARKTNTPNEWMAWIPVANIFLMIDIAKKPLWWFIFILIPLVNIVIGVILWMAIADRRGKPNWMGILIIIPIVGLAVPGYLAFFDYKSGEKVEITPPYAPTGTEEAYKPTVGYKHPCKYCKKLIPPNSTACPYCGKVNPLGPSRCPKCHEPTEKDWKVCAKCNLDLRITCPFCGKITFFGEHCEDCGARLLVKCPQCGQEQPPISDNCIKCGKPLKAEK